MSALTSKCSNSPQCLVKAFNFSGFAATTTTSLLLFLLSLSAQSQSAVAPRATVDSQLRVNFTKALVDLEPVSREPLLSYEEGPWPWAPAPIRHWWANHNHLHNRGQQRQQREAEEGAIEKKPKMCLINSDVNGAHTSHQNQARVNKNKRLWQTF